MINPSSFLRRALIADAVFSGVAAEVCRFADVSGFSFLTACWFFSAASVSSGPATGSFVSELKR